MPYIAKGSSFRSDHHFLSWSLVTSEHSKSTVQTFNNFGEYAIFSGIRMLIYSFSAIIIVLLQDLHLVDHFSTGHSCSPPSVLLHGQETANWRQQPMSRHRCHVSGNYVALPDIPEVVTFAPKHDRSIGTRTFSLVNALTNKIQMAAEKFMHPDFLREFIQSLPCLWKIKAAEYSNRHKRTEAYETLVQLCKRINPAANVDYVKNKISNISNVFRKEFNKVQSSKKSGASADDIYTPRLWYYDLLYFTVLQEIPRSPITLMGTALEPTQENVHS
ncbi:hypothetical protein XELAEV_18023379mg [Xenopus laevis]|uniref:MADF domain-containing protein n=1 Tax=Xenopus laevis TaxID=8355 RepID=A0A974D6X5_XENLA|nr:hypothetical protein XELAEV_18023379mg [Xenopus laevis]